MSLHIHLIDVPSHRAHFDARPTQQTQKNVFDGTINNSPRRQVSLPRAPTQPILLLSTRRLMNVGRRTKTEGFELRGWASREAPFDPSSVRRRRKIDRLAKWPRPPPPPSWLSGTRSRPPSVEIGRPSPRMDPGGVSESNYSARGTAATKPRKDTALVLSGGGAGG